MKRMLMKRGTVLALACFLLLGLVTGAAAESQWAVVTGTSSLNIRATPGTDGTWLGRAARGTWVEKIYQANDSWWYCRVADSNLYGFMSGAYLTGYEGGGSGTGTTGVVSNPAGTKFLNLREYPSYSARILGIFYNGQVCQILSSSNGWYNVLVNGMNGYFRAEYVQVNGGSVGETAVIRTGGAGYAPVYNAPSSSGSVLGQYPDGTLLTVLLKGTGWYMVQVNGSGGFMESRFLQNGATSAPTWSPVVTPVPTWNPVVTATPAPAAKGYCIVSNPKASSYLNLREQPSLTAKVLAQYYNGIRLEVLEQGETWCKVYGRASGKTGYVMTRFVKLYNLPSVPVKTVSNGSSYVNLRTLPNKITGTVLTKVYSGAQVTVLTPGDQWTRVRYGNQEGYMMTQFLK